MKGSATHCIWHWLDGQMPSGLAPSAARHAGALTFWTVCIVGEDCLRTVSKGTSTFGEIYLPRKYLPSSAGRVPMLPASFCNPIVSPVGPDTQRLAKAIHPSCHFSRVARVFIIKRQTRKVYRLRHRWMSSPGPTCWA